MPKFRLKGVTSQGKLLFKEFDAENKKQAKTLVNQVSSRNSFKVQSLEKKQTYVYKVKKPGKKPISGEQDAYTKQELQNALQNLGYEVIKVEKKLFNFKGRVPTSEVVSFVRLCADLLRQKLTFNEILPLLAEDISNKRMKATIRQIEKDFKEGKDGKEVYGKHKDIFGEFATYMLGIASNSGNMAEVFESTAKFLERDAEFKKNMRKTLLMPAITVLALLAAVIFYVGYIFPATAEMFLKFDMEMPPMTQFTLDMSNFLQEHVILISMLIIGPSILLGYFISTPNGRLWFDKTLIKIPIIGDLLHKTSIEIFSRVFYTLYTGSGENVDVIRIAASACRNKYMEDQIKKISIPMMLKDGKGLVESIEAAKVFPVTAISRFRLGSESGSLRDNAKQLADYYELQTGYKMDSTIAAINIAVSMFIMIVMVAITVVSAETAVIQPEIDSF